ncbi:MAG: A/G-specific adenine glycosylase [Parvularcula sp.]|jgi:A/G-specific adenine glycosylase|nr:A/G-specific adenine glycosylase [Parvularcula sp.]
MIDQPTPGKGFEDPERTGFADAVLAWYDREARDLPWRVPPGRDSLPDPYHVLVSEVMLQQTTVAVVRERFSAFLSLFSDVRRLAEAEEEDVLGAWAGLGYYRRARNLHACAKAVVSEHAGMFPNTEEALRTLPGVGDYTAAAIAAIAFRRPAVVVDGNIERIVARIFAIDEPLPGARKAIKAAATTLSSQARPGDYAQALMDLGATICRPRAPQCLLCPAAQFCEALRGGLAEELPRKAAKKARKKISGRLFAITRRDGSLAVETRPTDGLFAGMIGLPGDGWEPRAVQLPPLRAQSAGQFTHILTHREFSIEVLTAHSDESISGLRWMTAEEAHAAMPSFFKKALKLALSSDGS